MVYQSDIKATIPQVDPSYISLGTNSESTGAVGMWADYAETYSNKVINFTLSDVQETGMYAPGITAQTFSFSVTADQTGELTGLNDVNFDFPAGFDTYLDSYFDYTDASELSVFRV